MKKIKAPVLFDANILMRFKGQLGFLFSMFENVMIHKDVIEEVLESSIVKEINDVKKVHSNIEIVEDKEIECDIERIFFQECDKELKKSFNIGDSRDIGEYKSLLYAKFNEVKLFSSQDTTVWRFVNESLYFNDIDCICIQDIAYLIYLNSKNKKDRGLAKSLYKQIGRSEHPFECFKKHMNRNEDMIPGYFEFEDMRIKNYEELVEGYVRFYGEDFDSKRMIQKEIVGLALKNTDTCIACLHSRIDMKNVDYGNRICNLQLSEEDCEEVCEKFSEHIKKRGEK